MVGCVKGLWSLDGLTLIWHGCVQSCQVCSHCLDRYAQTICIALEACHGQRSRCKWNWRHNGIGNIQLQVCMNWCHSHSGINHCGLYAQAAHKSHSMGFITCTRAYGQFQLNLSMEVASWACVIWQVEFHCLLSCIVFRMSAQWLSSSALYASWLIWPFCRNSVLQTALIMAFQPIISQVLPCMKFETMRVEQAYWQGWPGWELDRGWESQFTDTKGNMISSSECVCVCAM